MDVRVLIVDDHATIRESLLFVFAAEGWEHVMEASTCEEALHILRTRPVDVVLLDVALGCSNGINALPELRAIAPSAAILMHSHRDSPQLLWLSIEQGAAGYVVKGQDKNLLLDAIRRVAEGERAWTTEQEAQIREWDAGIYHANQTQPTTLINETD